MLKICDVIFEMEEGKIKKNRLLIYVSSFCSSTTFFTNDSKLFTGPCLYGITKSDIIVDQSPKVFFSLLSLYSRIFLILRLSIDIVYLPYLIIFRMVSISHDYPTI